MSSTQDIIAAAQTILHNPVIRNPWFDLESAYQNVSHSNTTPAAPAIIYNYPVGGQFGAKLASVSVSADSVFQSNFYWAVFIDGVTGPAGKNFKPFDPTVNTYEAVPAAEFYLLKPFAVVQILAYNQGGTSTNGTLSVSIAADLLTQDEQTILQKYINTLGEIARG